MEERPCNECIHHISGKCAKWNCEQETLEEHDKKTESDVIGKFAEWLIRYKVIPDGTMQELVRDFIGEV